MHNSETVPRCLQMLAAAFHFRLDELTLEAYLMALDKLPPDKMLPATRRLMQIAKFMPKPAEIYEAAGVDPSRPAIPPHIRTRQMLEQINRTTPGQQRYIPEKRAKTLSNADNNKADREAEVENRKLIREAVNSP